MTWRTLKATLILNEREDMVKLEDIVEVLQAELIGQNVEFDDVSTDTRTLEKNNLFFALTGPNFDGHDYLQTAKNKNAAAAVVTKPIDVPLPQLKVSDTIEALGRLAAFHRDQFDLPVIGITGSCGKTTTKMMVANILQLKAKILFTEGTKNNHIGCPLTLLRLQKEHQYAVIEMGANAPRDIQYLCSLAKPTVTTVTNVAPAHLEGFGSIKGVASAKSEIYQALSGEGVAVINADDAYANYMISQSKSKNYLRFGIQNEAEVQARNIQLDERGKPSFTLVVPEGQVEIMVPLVGEHNVMNALAAAAICIALNIPLSQIKTGLETLKPIDMRLVHYPGVNHSTVLDDTYNANPRSFDAALHVLMLAKGPKFLVVGDMGELGENVLAFHEEIGVKAKNLGVDRLFAYGEYSQEAARAFGKNATCYLSHDALIADLQSELAKQANVSLLVKGSRKSEMETVVRAIITDNTPL